MNNGINKSVTTKLTLPNDLRYLPLAMNFVLENAAIVGFEDKEKKDIHLAVEEAVSNVIEHAFLPEDEAEFTIICERILLGLKIVGRESQIREAKL